MLDYWLHDLKQVGMSFSLQRRDSRDPASTIASRLEAIAIRFLMLLGGGHRPPSPNLALRARSVLSGGLRVVCCGEPQGERLAGRREGFAGPESRTSFMKSSEASVVTSWSVQSCPCHLSHGLREEVMFLLLFESFAQFHRLRVVSLPQTV